MITSMIRPMIRPMIRAMIGGIGGSVDPVPGFLFRYLMDGNDTALTPVLSPAIVSGLELPDLKASNFNGADQFYNSSDLALTGVETGAFSVVVRFRTTALISKVLVSTGNGADASTFRLRITGTGTLQMRIGGGNLVTSGGFNDGNWYHVVYTYSGSGGESIVYIDGAFNSTKLGETYNLVGAGALQVAAQTATALFDGDIDGVRFYDRVLTPTEVTALNNNRIWQPTDITTLGWYDPSRLSTIISSSNLVSQLTDIGSSGIEHLIQGTALNQMSTSVRTANGLNILSSTSADHTLARAGFIVPASGNLSLSFIAQIDGLEATTTSSLMSMDSPTGDWQFNSQGTTQFDGQISTSFLGIGNVNLSGGPFDDVLRLWTLEFNFDNSTLMVYVDGILRGSSTDYTIKLIESQLLRVFTNRAGTQSVFGAFGEMIITEDVTEATRLNVQNYLTDKWINPFPELVTNGYFANGTDDWSVEGGATLSVTDGVMRVEDTSGGGLSQAFQFVNLVAGKTYVVECDAKTVVGTFAHFIIGREGGSDFDERLTSLTTFNTLSMEFTPVFTSGDDGLGYRVILRESGTVPGDIAEFRNVSVREKN